MAVSLGNFATNLVLIRSLEPSAFGVYTVLWTLMLLLNTLQSSLIAHPMLVISASEKRRARGLAAAGLRATVAMILPFGGVILFASVLLHRPGLALWIVPALLAWQLQEALRRALMARRRYRDCIWGDSISYIGQAILVASLAAAGLLTLPAVFACMTGSSLLAAGIQFLQVRPGGLSSNEFAGAIGDFWKIGRWIANQNVVAAVVTTALPWYMAWLHGPVGAAEYQALYYVTGIAQPLMMSIGSLVGVEAARSSARAARGGNLRAVARPVTLGGAAITVYGLFLAIFPKAALTVLFSSQSPYLRLAPQLRIFILAMLCMYWSQMLVEILVGYRKTRAAFLSQLYGSLACAVIGLVAVPVAGVAGAGFALAAAHLVRLVAAGTWVRGTVFQRRKWHAPEPAIAAGEVS
jgi:O-antigen/teichoic acid export membrane protein